MNDFENALENALLQYKAELRQGLYEIPSNVMAKNRLKESIKQAVDKYVIGSDVNIDSSMTPEAIEHFRKVNDVKRNIRWNIRGKL